MVDYPKSVAPAHLPLVGADASLRETVEVIDRHGKGIALVADRDRRLVATVTDGDVRRAMLSGLSLDAHLDDLLTARPPGRSVPATAPVGTAPAELVALMQPERLRQIPLVGDDGRIAGLATLEDLIGVAEPPLRALVMAGGFGRRLAPLTDKTPKPMLPVGDRPLLEHIVEQLRDAGVRHINVTTHYLGDVIVEHFGDGRDFGVEIEYVSEESPLGTAGALGLVDAEGPLLVMNGDLLTRIDLRAMHRFHDEHTAAMTAAVRPYELNVPFGLVQLDGELVTGIDEKPLLRGFANAGVYLIDPDVCRLVRAGERIDMPELIGRLLDAGRRVVGFPLREYWLDIGHIEDYEQAAAEASAWRES